MNSNPYKFLPDIKLPGSIPKLSYIYYYGSTVQHGLQDATMKEYHGLLSFFWMDNIHYWVQR